MADKYAFDKATLSRIQTLFNDLNVRLNNGEHSKALALSDEILKLSPNDIDALRCKVYCLMQSDKWSLAFDTIQSYKSNAASCPQIQYVFAFEKIYCLYKKNRLKEAFAVLNEYKMLSQNARKNVKNADSGSFVLDQKFLLLEAQLYTRVSENLKARDIYSTLLPQDARNVLLMVNVLAASLLADETSPMPISQNELKFGLEESYELGFNLACYFIEKQELQKASYYLSKAEALCKKEIRQEDPSLDIVSLNQHFEVVQFTVQKAYILHRLGQLQEAEELYLNVLQQQRIKSGTNEVDPTVLAVATNNLEAIKPSLNELLTDRLNQIEVNSKISLKEKLTKKQGLAISINNSLALLRKKELEQCRKGINAAINKYGNCPELQYINVAVQIVENKFKKVQKQLNAKLKAEPSDVMCMLGLIYLYICRKEYTKASNMLLAIVKYVPTVTCAYFESLLTLKELAEDTEGVENALDLGYAYFLQQQDTLSIEQKGRLLRVFCNSCWRLKNWKRLSHFSKCLLDLVDGSDLTALCYLVFSASFHNLPLAEKYSGRLRDFLPSFVVLTDPEDLLSMDWQTAVLKNKSRTDTISKEKMSAISSKPKKVRKRTRYPKSFDPNKPGPLPDPERWLPKHKRSTFKKKLRRRKEVQRTQGALPSSATTGRSAGPSTAHVPASSDTRKKGGRRSGRR